MKIIAVIGLGNIARRHRQNLKLLFPTAKVIALSASGRIVNEPIEFADLQLSNIETLIDNKPELVIVASPSPYHETHASMLIQHNIPVLIEKPLTSELESANRLLALSQTHSGQIMVGYCLRYLSSAIEVKRLLSEDFIGELYNCQASVGQYLPDWRPNKHYTHSVSANKSLGGGALLELSHELDYLHWLLGPLELNYAQLRNTKELGLDIEEIADLILTNHKGCLCSLHMDFIQKQAQRECTFIGSKGRLHWDLLANTVTHHSHEGTQLLYSAPEWDKNQMYINMLTDFINNIKRGECTTTSLEDASQTVSLIAQIKQQATWGVTQ
ncbi:Gfo/Idh/MocA family oxidoreductase [Shewanella sp. D64]|uniref:Gfo/Idh/MocA family protein n=1 Tax=unclassified Shewanella TaxID=196818 RepID=UPI0022BA55B2|nr:MULTISPECIES: Gfo/Idh/MocA family oxidoreductase [unclassified Shewanella]MEC4726564.1 Gfo/Idh/MocA family oxidoreductase [Shewanella sp. D64]MEC4737395.1 Gfo/Idh/MocA family oxidoreductase [Shewanella sp. E94]WBJ97214.1 Gfo/Idh/MocA family oxidoreductase [Shewanella sp. MTB7]